jgi:hypothetical protein
MTKWATLRAILALAALEDLELESIDISNANLTWWRERQRVGVVWLLPDDS